MVPIIGSGKFITTSIITNDGEPIEVEGLDVVRTDRALSFYEAETNQAKLWDILAIYSWVDDDIGCIQGMNGISSQMVILFENEVDAFWCFERAMQRLRKNFRCSATSIRVQSQLGTLSQVIKTIDTKLHQHLEDLDGGEYLFAFRMLMVLFRREFSFVDALYLWEILGNITGNLDAKKACLDVVQIDRALSFYETKTNQARLWDILAIYSWVGDDIGYVQGLNDICSPMVIFLENEADTFWCFEHAMRRLVLFFLQSFGCSGLYAYVLCIVIKTICNRCFLKQM
ncbi:hypothetical protein REPUB_Repub17cG0075500 [Reevesia pubescens]